MYNNNNNNKPISNAPDASVTGPEARIVSWLSVCIYLCVCLYLTAFPHYCMDPDVTWGNGREGSAI